ncbi:MAG: hypothetical protein GC190_06415 [Alphaproteobacteria bacterium]|nr:hypothetical protein [Alphaproteobacteria bacterium]
MKQFAPRAIQLETPNYIVRSLETADITEGWQSWLADPVTANNLNARPAKLTFEELADFVRSFDRVTAHLLGIFDKCSGLLIGIRAVMIDAEQDEFLVNILVGETGARNKGARSETRDVMYRYFFEEMDLASARCSVLGTNQQILKVMDRNGWVHEHSSYKPAANREAFVELRHYRLTRDEWRRREAQRTIAEVALK